MAKFHIAKNILHKLFSCVKRLISEYVKILRIKTKILREIALSARNPRFYTKKPLQSVIFTVALASRSISAGCAPSIIRLYASLAIIAALSVQSLRGG